MSAGGAPGREPPIDVLSDVLRGVRLSGVLLFQVEASSPWVAEAPPTSVLGPILLPRAQHVVSYHVLLEGECHCELPGERPILLRAGDILVIPHGDRYALSSSPGMLGSSAESEIREWFVRLSARAVPDPFVFVEGGGEAETRRLLCGFLGCDAFPFNPVLATLPRALRVRVSQRSDDRLEHLIAYARAEVREQNAGRECALLRISELLFVEVLRRHLADSPSPGVGWLAGLRDPIVGQVLGLLHAQPARPWTVDELARRAAVSRSALAERFTDIVRQPPIQYLARWRMQLAARRLADDDVKVAAVALEVGYDSEAAFSRAFKASIGMSPALWRKRRRR